MQPQIPIDDPALHQGRRRTTPHVEGQFAAYVYVPLLIPKQSQLYTLLMRMYAAAKLLVPSLNPIGFEEPAILPPNLAESGSSDSTGTSIELHISLTRPTYLRAHQREEFRGVVRSLARTRRRWAYHPPVVGSAPYLDHRSRFSASFATISELTNDERTRTFLTLEIGAGHDEVRLLCTPCPARPDLSVYSSSRSSRP